jgi:acyl phosphate:glycerol-3-phosphate acyltransferase
VLDVATAIVWVLVAVGAYLVGTFPTAILVGRTRGVDPTAQGSGNPGASNVYRTAGKRAGVVTLVGDMVKGVVASGAGWLIDGRKLGFLCFACAVVGHIFPATRRFRGGKGVATTGGGVLVLTPLVAVICLTEFFLVAKFGRKASIGSLVAAVLVPVLAAVFGGPLWEVAVYAGVCALVIARHASNIKRLVRGKEQSV